MTALFTKLFEIFRLRSGPEDLPVSWSWIIFFLMFNLLAGIELSRHLSTEAPATIAHIADLSLQVVILLALLNIRGVPERTAQTLLAFAGTGFLFTLILIGLSLGLVQAENSFGRILAQWGLLIWFIWYFAVAGHIYARSLSINMPLGIGIAVITDILRHILLESI